VSPRLVFIETAYLTASVLFVLGLRSLTHPDRARRGMQLAALGMAIAIAGTLVNREIVRYDWILAGLALGSVIGYPLGVYVPMTAMPQRVAISHMFGAIAATLVGIAEFYRFGHGAEVARPQMAALGFEVLFGSLTVTGSFMAFGSSRSSSPPARSPSAARTSSPSASSWWPWGSSSGWWRTRRTPAPSTPWWRSG
jgi:NAD(P) transhydrogenase subunit beta